MDKGYKLHRWGDNVAALLKKIEDFQENFILMRGCGDELAGGTRRCFFNFSYNDIATPVLADKAVFLSWEDRITNLPPVLASCSYVNLGVSGVTVSIDKGEVRRRLLLTRGTNGEIVVAADESYNIVEQENDPIFTQWLQSHELYTKREVDDLLTPIESVIPSSASPSNKLADKDYVDNSIATSTAIFVGTFNSLSELQAVQNPTNNDYGFVIEHDAQGNEYYKRYKYNGTQWLFEYQVESTPFTAAQWAAIQSGITSSLVTKLNDLPNAQELNAINSVISVEGTTKTEVSSEEEVVISGADGNTTVSVNPMGVQVTAPNSRTFTYNGKQVATRDQIPEYVSQLTNDRGYIRMADLQEPLEYLLGQKQDAISDLSTIRSGASAGATAYQKPSDGIPKTDLASAVQESLGKADAAAPQANTYTKNEIDEIIESIGSPITEIQRSALDNTTTPGMYKVVGTTGSSAANSSWISLLLVSDYDFSMIGGSTNHIVTQRLFNGRGASDSVKIEERTKTNNGSWSEWADIYGSDIDEIWEELDAKQGTISDLDDIRAGAALGATALQSFTETDPTVPAWAKQSTKPSYTAQEVGALPSSTTIPTKVSDLTNDSGFTTNTGTITGITMNGASKGTSGVVNLGTVITAHQDISGKADVAALAGYTPTSGFATINGASITGGGNVVITAGSSSITTIDATPTSGSTNPVQSGGVYDAIEGGFYY